MENDHQKRIKALLSTYRQAIMILFLTTSAMMLSVFVRVRDIQFFGIEIPSYSLPSVIMTGGMLLAVASFLNKYLDKQVSVIETKSVQNKSSEEIHRLIDKQQKEQKGALREIEDLKSQVENLLKHKEKEQASWLGDEEKNELVNSLKKQIAAAASSDYLNEIKLELGKDIDESASSRLEKHFLGTMKRLSNEINELGKRAKVNLIIGSVAALSGVSVFVLFVLEKTSPGAVDTYLITDFAPRISLVIVIEIFAYFFLGLYKSNLSEIKYFHNELTNVESKYLALEEAIALSDEDAQKEIVKEISKTERNFLLKKGESTVATEEKRMALEENRNTIQKLAQNMGSK
ncbi:hypothetical protein FEI13_17095 [Halomonas urmiana]|uniref:Uncharacterized protein n=1 Tax=Halomonas urmiana TaxID=490901 RepID=A0A5R8M929_9GAMM|nr:hypothetical protein [Halomonas urmiana]TLF46071.1 hypothetical protein FEI13_17095 [Halomonas urmiana]